MHLAGDPEVVVPPLGVLVERLLPEDKCRTSDDARLVRYIRIFRRLHPRILAERRVSRTDIFNAIFGDDTTRCWGVAASGRLGNGDDATAMGDDPQELQSLTPIPFTERAVSLCTGYRHSCALFEGGAVRCWRNNDFGQLGQGHTDHIGANLEDTSTLPAIDLGEPATRVAAGFLHTCALLQSGQLKCWGKNSNYTYSAGTLNYVHTGRGQLGQEELSAVTADNNLGDDEGEMNVLPPVDVGTHDNGTPIQVINVSVGVDHTCALLETHQVKCWGANHRGQLGLGDTRNNIGFDPQDMGNNLPPIALGTHADGEPFGVIEVSANSSYTCAIRSDSREILGAHRVK